jgi:hypothetical protein
VFRSAATKRASCQSGNALHVDVAISKRLTKEFAVGLLAAHYQQVGDDGGAGNRIGPFKGRVTAGWATATYNRAGAGTPVTVRVKFCAR